jgi:hypothetical protein
VEMCARPNGDIWPSVTPTRLNKTLLVKFCTIVNFHGARASSNEPNGQFLPFFDHGAKSQIDRHYSQIARLSPFMPVRVGSERQVLTL